MADSDESTLMRFIHAGSSRRATTKELVSADLAQIRQTLQNEFQMLTSSTKTMSQKSERMMYLFQRDLMPAVSGQILDAKQNRDASQVAYVSAPKKLLGWLYVVTINLCMLFYILLFAIQESPSRQGAWFKSFCIWLVMDIFLICTMVVVVTHIAIPMLTMKDIEKIKEKMIMTVRDHLKARRNRDEDEEKMENDTFNSEFNAAEYMFASYRLAKLLPNIPMSEIIVSFRTVWPKRSYLHQVDNTKQYSGKFSAINKTISMVIVSLISTSTTLPPAIQDIITHVTSTTVMGYTVLVHLQLFHVFPVLVIIPTIIIGLCVHFLLRGMAARSRAEMSKLMPVTPKNKDRVADQYKLPAAQHVADSSTTFVTRRQSLVAGKLLLQNMQQQASACNKNHDDEDHIENGTLDDEHSDSDDAAEANGENDMYQEVPHGHDDSSSDSNDDDKDRDTVGKLTAGSFVLKSAKRRVRNSRMTSSTSSHPSEATNGSVECGIDSPDVTIEENGRKRAQTSDSSMSDIEDVCIRIVHPCSAEIKTAFEIDTTATAADVCDQSLNIVTPIYAGIEEVSEPSRATATAKGDVTFHSLENAAAKSGIDVNADMKAISLLRSKWRESIKEKKAGDGGRAPASTSSKSVVLMDDKLHGSTESTAPVETTSGTPSSVIAGNIMSPSPAVASSEALQEQITNFRERLRTRISAAQTASKKR